MNDNIIRFKNKPVANDTRAPSPVPSPPFLNLPEGTKILTLSIIIVHIILWGLSFLIPTFPLDLIYSELGFVAARWTGHMPFDGPAVLSLVTVNFLHAGFFHLFVNAATIVAFAAGIEKRLGVKNMLVIFFLSTVVALFTHMAFSPLSIEPVIGASGGISGLFGAVLVMLKHDGRLNGYNQKILPTALIWIVITIVFGVMGTPGGNSIAWIAHIGGFLGGMGLAYSILRRH